MLYPYWSPCDTTTLSNWLRAGQLCLCSEAPTLARRRIGIDCWLGDRWVTQRPWTLAMQIPAVNDSAWHQGASDVPPDSRRLVILAVQDLRCGGFHLGRHISAEAEHWRIFNAGRWSPIHNAAILGWLKIPQHIPHRLSTSLEASRERLLAQVR